MAVELNRFDYYIDCMKKFELYSADIESVGLELEHDIIELSLCRISTCDQKTWCLKPFRTDNIQPDALRVNGHNLDDLLHKTKEGQQRYRNATTVIAEIENWLMEDFTDTDNRILVGHNLISFDKPRLIELWRKCNSSETFPFNKRYALDTMQMEFLADYCRDESSESYSLFTTIKKYGIKNDKAHSAAADVKATTELFNKQISLFKKSFSK